MKPRGILGAMALAALLFGVQPSPARAVTRISASVEFYNALEPYGDWETIPRYGDCWVPNRPAGWRPYTVGYWVDTDYGWMWISQDPWGDVPYHYGRWAFDSRVGWVWVPDDDLVWAPSWCAWRYGDDYVGWAPLPPDADWGGSGFSINVSFIDRSIDRSGWCFTPVRTFGTRNVRYSILPPAQNVTLIARTTSYTRYEARGSMPVARGVPPELLTRATGRRFQRYNLADASSPARMSRPAIRGRTIEVNRATIVGAQRERARLAPRGGNAQDMRQRGNERGRNQDIRQNRGAVQRDQRANMRRQNQDAEMRRQQQSDMRRQQQQSDMRRQQQQSDMRRQRQQQSQDRSQRDQQQYERRGRGPDQGNGGSRDQNQGRWRREQRPPQDQQPQPPPQQQQRQRGGRDQGQGQAPDQNQKQQPDKGKGRGQRDRNQNQDQDQSQQQDDQNKDRGHGRGHGG